MIHLFPVGQLMHHHIIQQHFIQKNQLPVKIEIPQTAAAAPSGFLFFDENPVVVYAHQRCKVFHPIGDFPAGQLPVISSAGIFLLPDGFPGVFPLPFS